MAKISKNITRRRENRECITPPYKEIILAAPHQTFINLPTRPVAYLVFLSYSPLVYLSKPLSFSDEQTNYPLKPGDRVHFRCTPVISSSFTIARLSPWDVLKLRIEDACSDLLDPFRALWEKLVESCDTLAADETVQDGNTRPASPTSPAP